MSIVGLYAYAEAIDFIRQEGWKANDSYESTVECVIARAGLNGHMHPVPLDSAERVIQKSIKDMKQYMHPIERERLERYERSK